MGYGESVEIGCGQHVRIALAGRGAAPTEIPERGLDLALKLLSSPTKSSSQSSRPDLLETEWVSTWRSRLRADVKLQATLA